MPTIRGSTTHSEQVELHGVELVHLLMVVEETTEDGLVEPCEDRLLQSAMRGAAQSFAPLPGSASAQDGAFRAIGAIAGGGKVTRWARRVVREEGDDLERLEAAA